MRAHWEGGHYAECVPVEGMEGLAPFGFGGKKPAAAAADSIPSWRSDNGDSDKFDKLDKSDSDSDSDNDDDGDDDEEEEEEGNYGGGTLMIDDMDMDMLAAAAAYDPSVLALLEASGTRRAADVARAPVGHLFARAQYAQG